MDDSSVLAALFSRLRNRLSQIEQRTAFDVFIVLLILIGLAASVYLAGQRQIFRSRAAGGGAADVVNEQGQALPKNQDGSVTVETQQIRLKIDFPTDWNTQSLLPQINSAHAQVSTPSITSAEWFAYGILIVNGSNFGSSAGSTYYSPGGSAETSLSIRSWSNTSIQVSTPNYDVNLSGYLMVCRSDGQCSNWWSGIPAYASTQSTATPTCLGSGGKCASPNAQDRGVTSEGLLCQSYLSNSALDQNCANTSPGYNYCYTSCAQPTAVPTRPPAAVQPTATSAPVQACGGRWEGKKTTCSNDAKLDQAGCTYLEAWSHPKSPECGATTPFCWACPESAFSAPAQPTSPPPQAVTQPPQGAAQPPTATPEPESTLFIQVSQKNDKLGKDKCTPSDNPADHCLQFSIADPYFTERERMVGWWLPNQPGLHTIYI